MLTNIKELIGLSIDAKDERLGSVADIFFDDHFWTVRYLVVDTSEWLFGRKVLISPQSADAPNVEEGTIAVDLTAEEVRNGPEVGTELPVSRQAETDLVNYFGWVPYWNPLGAHGRGPTLAPVRTSPDRPQQPVHEGDPNLRSIEEVTGYHIAVTDGEIGHAEDFLIQLDDWLIRYMVVETGNWFDGKRILVAPDWIRSIDWDDSRVHVDLTREAIKNSPEYDPSKPVDRDYERSLYEHYGRTAPWDEKARQPHANEG